MTGRWRPLSLAPSLSGPGLREFASKALLFMLVLAYPFGARAGRDPEGRFVRSTLTAIMAIGVLIATIGLLRISPGTAGFCGSLCRMTGRAAHGG